ncbi:MAG: D-ribitol-5-phosphate cytidylyltransferase [Bacteroidales bacterium]|nr:D-ribitol-5-phosphate cytidylyltransferase [Bacteroidales bacterium]
MIYGAILAGGIGKRIERTSIPKQFISVNGVAIIIYSVRKFLENKRMDVIYVAVNDDWIKYAEKLFEYNFSREQLNRLRIVPGGRERLDSFTNILDDIMERPGYSAEDIIICHDSVRPFVTRQMIDDCIDATYSNGTALTVVPVNDTVFTSPNGDFLEGTTDRSTLFNGQTPSGFNIRLLSDTISQFTEEQKRKITGTTQLMLMSGHKVKIVAGRTSNFKITTDNDLDVAEKVIKSDAPKHGVQLLDCTLRDGGIVIDFNFGLERMLKIKSCLEDSGVDYIETGYIDGRKGSPKERSCFDNEQSIAETLLCRGKCRNVSYLGMIDYGTFNLDDLNPRNGAGIDGIRFAFHKENLRDALSGAKTIIRKGYDLYVQPMVVSRYNDEEFRELIAICNDELPQARSFYIVDSFGQLDSMMLLRKLEIADQYVSDNMKIGFHAHNNRQMAFSNALAALRAPSRHDLIIDSCIMGMGKGAGNLCTELIMPELIAEGKPYNTEPIYGQIGEYFTEVQKTNPWGYNFDYYLSSIYSCTPSYIKLFKQDERVTTDVLIRLLENIPEEKKSACDRLFAQKYLESFFSQNDVS